jgi:hypothetical protein
VRFSSFTAGGRSRRHSAGVSHAAPAAAGRRQKRRHAGARHHQPPGARGAAQRRGAPPGAAPRLPGGTKRTQSAIEGAIPSCVCTLDGPYPWRLARMGQWAVSSGLSWAQLYSSGAMQRSSVKIEVRSCRSDSAQFSAVLCAMPATEGPSAAGWALHSTACAEHISQALAKLVNMTH